MSIGPKLEAKLNKKYPPSSRIDDVFIGNDITILTNQEGEAIRLYIGERRENGEIKGELYERREKIVNGIKKTHWDNKGKVVGNL